MADSCELAAESCRLQAKYSFTIKLLRQAGILNRTTCASSSFWRPAPWSLYKTLRRHPKRMWRIYYRGEENRKMSFKVIDSSLCVIVPLPVFPTKHSCYRSEWRFWESTSLVMGNGKRHNDGERKASSWSDSEGSVTVVRKTARCHSEWKETKGCPLFIRSQRRGAFPELRVKLF